MATLKNTFDGVVPTLSGGLFPSSFLDAFSTSDMVAKSPIGASEPFLRRLRNIVDTFPTSGRPNEAQTEDDLIWPILTALGWDNHLRQQNLSPAGRSVIPDGVLFRTQDDKTRANKRDKDYLRYRDGVCLVESKRWDRPLDRQTRGEDDAVTPSFQILNYLSRASVITDDRIRWGILTNGRLWRLYWQGANVRRQEYLEVDISSLIRRGDPNDALVFRYLFGPRAFETDPDSGRLLIETAALEGRRFERELADNLSGMVYTRAFPLLARGLADANPGVDLEQIRNATLTTLYRLLFVFFAEDRGLLPIRSESYANRSLRRAVRDRLAAEVKDGWVYSENDTQYWNQFKSVCNMIDRGDSKVGVPAYNGGLFNRDKHAILQSTSLPDTVFAEVLKCLCMAPEGELNLGYVNFRDLSVQQLGSIYEQLLEYELVRGESGHVEVARTVTGRKESSSYYTRDELVELTLRQTLDPLVAQARETDDPAEAVLSLRICDIATGSGHFLVSLVDYLTDSIATLVSEHEGISSVMEQVEATRRLIQANAKAQGWSVDDAHLDDPQLIKRMVLKRCIYGVDKNPMAVELAKVSLWLHTFTVGAPLSFLDHHLVHGDSVFGYWVSDWADDLHQEASLLFDGLLDDAKQGESQMRAIEMRADAEMDEVEASRRDYLALRNSVSRLEDFMSFAFALKWLDLSKAEQGLVGAFYSDNFGAPEWIASGRRPPLQNSDKGKAFHAIWERARALVVAEAFLHWEVAFPGVWRNWVDRGARTGGFDAVIGNPPWNQFEFVRKEWLSQKNPKAERIGSAKELKAEIARLKSADPERYAEFTDAETKASQQVRLGKSLLKYFADRKYQLHYHFVERAFELVRPGGRVGLVVPSGVMTNKGAKGFVGAMVETGQVKAFIDFQNGDYRQGRYFPEVHGQTRFCVLVLERSLQVPLLPSVEVSIRSDIDRPIQEQTETVDHAQLRTFSPVTGLLPSFPDDAAMQTGLMAADNAVPFVESEYADVFVFSQMFNATSDMTQAVPFGEMDSAGIVVTTDGYVGPHGQYLPEIQGKNVGMYDYRANTIYTNPKNTKRQAQERPSSLEDLDNPSYEPAPFRVAPASLWPADLDSDWLLAFKDVTSNDNSRTMIAAVIPKSIPTHTLPVLLPAPSATSRYAELAPVLLANLNSIPYDFLIKTKIQTSHVSFYVVEESLVIPANRRNEMSFGFDVDEEIKSRVRLLTAHSCKLATFPDGLSLGLVKYDVDGRRHHMARLDALFFHLYGIARDSDINTVFESFDRMKRREEKAFKYFQTRELVRAYVKLYRADDTTSVVDLESLDRRHANA